MHSTNEPYPVALYRLCAKNRRRYGGYLTHLGLVLLFAGFTGKAFTQEAEVVLDQGGFDVKSANTRLPLRRWPSPQTPTTALPPAALALHRGRSISRHPAAGATLLPGF